MKNLILALLVCVLLSGCLVTSRGEKVGVIVKCANEGLFVKTYECEIIRGGMNSASGTLGKSFDFTVEDKELISSFEKALNDQKQVHLYYHHEVFTFLRSESDNFVDKIEFN